MKKNYKVYKNRRNIGIATLVGVGSISTNIIGSFVKERIAQTRDNSGENEIGYDGMNLLINKAHTNNFVMLHINKEDNISIFKEKISFFNKNDISVGLVLDASSTCLVDMYQEIDLLQAIIKEYKVDLPIYLNIDSLMKNTILNNAQKAEIINVFTDKLSRSNVYIGIYGTDSNLVDCNNYISNIEEYDCLVVKESEEIAYKGTHNIVKELNGELTSSYDISRVIKEKRLNDASNMVYSATYVAKQSDTYHSLALRYGLSEDDLRQYNDCPRGELVKGTIVKIPNLYVTHNLNTNEVSYNYAVSRGIDISSYQTELDWNRILGTSDFVIVQVARDPSNYEETMGSYKAVCIEQIKNVVDNNIDLGLYFCIQKDMKISVYRQRLEEYFTLLEKNLLDNNIELERSNIPVFLDFETYYEHNDYYRLMSTFEAVCKQYGFNKIGIYANGSTLNSISSSLEKEERSITIKDTGWIVWKSGGPQYSTHEQTDTGVTLDELVEIKNESTIHYTPTILQVTNVCKDTGAANYVGNCDVNYCYSEDLFGKEDKEMVEYVEVDLNHYKDVNPVAVANVVMGALTAVGCAIIGIDVTLSAIKLKIRQEKKEKQKQKILK